MMDAAVPKDEVWMRDEIDSYAAIIKVANNRMHRSRGSAAFSNQVSLAATAVMRVVIGLNQNGAYGHQHSLVRKARWMA